VEFQQWEARYGIGGRWTTIIRNNDSRTLTQQASLQESMTLASTTTITLINSTDLATVSQRCKVPQFATFWLFPPLSV
jgi:hypothetical protein